jgi:hypothetical protein
VAADGDPLGRLHASTLPYAMRSRNSLWGGGLTRDPPARGRSRMA